MIWWTRLVARLFDSANASLVVAAEALRTRKIFSVDRKDFLSYPIRCGYRLVTFEMVGP
jgi:hypothetical protein